MTLPIAQTGPVTGPVVSGHWGVLEWSLVIVPALVVLFVFYVWSRGRKIDGDNVFRASRFSRSNRIFPAQVMITPSSITFFKPQLIGKFEESIHLAHVASIKIDTGMVFADLCIETSGGQDPIVCHGHTKGDVLKMKKLIEEYQSVYYRTRSDTR